MALTAVTLAEIERVFAVLDRLGISREAVVIPLRPAHPGAVRVLETGKNKGKLEITVEAEAALDGWLDQLEATLRGMLAGGG